MSLIAKMDYTCDMSKNPVNWTIAFEKRPSKCVVPIEVKYNGEPGQSRLAGLSFPAAYILSSDNCGAIVFTREEDIAKVANALYGGKIAVKDPVKRFKKDYNTKEVCYLLPEISNIVRVPNTYAITITIKKGTVAEPTSETKLIPTAYNRDYSRRRRKIEIGTELELEGNGKIWEEPRRFGDTRPRKMRAPIEELLKMAKVKPEAGYDGSVANCGIEIRFGHPVIKEWTKERCEKAMKLLQEAEFKAGPSAGQHVHVSHPAIEKAVCRFVDELKLMNEFLAPISCRNRNSYGLGNNIYRNQLGQFGTLEIRCWESTTNPELFRTRLRFSRMLVDYLASNKPMKDIWMLMPKPMERLYVYMLFTENPHKFGAGVKTVLKKMPPSATKLAKEVYNYEGE